MEKDQYLRASQLNKEIEYNESLVDELTSWLESGCFEGATMYFVNGEGGTPHRKGIPRRRQGKRHRRVCPPPGEPSFKKTESRI